MTTYTWPTGYVPQTAALRTINNNRSNMAAESGVTQTVNRPGSRWGWSITMPPLSNDRRAAFEGFLARLGGMEHRVSVYDWQRPRPRGTCNTSGVTVSVTASAFATSVVLTGCGASKTLLAGDWIKFATGQLCMVAADATANGSGVMTIEIRHALRAQVTSASAVTLVQPTALYILTESTLEMARQPGPVQPALGFDLVEVFA